MNKLRENIIKEERGLAAFPYLDAVDEVYEYVAKEIPNYLHRTCSKFINTVYNSVQPNEKKRKEYEIESFYIPKYLTKKFDFINDLKIRVNINALTDNADIDVLWGNGETTYSNTQKILSNGKLDVGNMTITCVYSAYSNKLLERTFYNNFLHEMNHLYLIYQQLKKQKNNSMEKISSYQREIYLTYLTSLNNIMFQNPERDFKKNYYQQVLYKLFNYNEINAAVAGMFGCLKHCKTREEVMNELKNTQPYIECNTFIARLDKFINNLTESDLQWIKQSLKIYHVDLNGINGDFKTVLRRKILRQVNYYKKKADKTVSLYLDSIEDYKKLTENKELTFHSWNDFF